MGCSSCQEPVTAWALHRTQLPSSHFHLLQCGGIPRLQVENCSLMGCRSRAVSAWSSPRAAGEPQPCCLEHLLSLSFTDPDVSHFSHSSLTPALQHFLHFVKHSVVEVQSVTLRGSAVPWDGLAGATSVQNRTATAPPHRATLLGSARAWTRTRKTETKRVSFLLLKQQFKSSAQEYS